MKYLQTTGFIIIAAGIIGYASYTFSLTVAQRRAKQAQFNQILTVATNTDQLKEAQNIIDELNKGSAARDAQAMAIELAKRTAELKSSSTLQQAQKDWQQEKDQLEAQLHTAHQSADRFEKELNLCLKKMEKQVSTEKSIEDLRKEVKKEKERAQRLQSENETLSDSNLECLAYFENLKKYFALDALTVPSKQLIPFIDRYVGETIVFYNDLQSKASAFMQAYEALPSNCKTIESKLVQALNDSLGNFPNYFKQK